MVAPLLEMSGIVKSFPGVRALDGVDLRLESGEVLALLGENGAGKSTLIKVLGGVHQPDAGRVRLGGEEVAFTSPARARAAGIGVIHQEFPLVPHLTVSENIFLGRELLRRGVIDRGAERARAAELFERIGLSIDPTAPCHTLSIAERQVVEIAKALATDVRVLVMDEPTATLTPKEVDHLFDVLRELVARGIGILYITHRLDEVFKIAGRVTVLRDGVHVGGGDVADLTRRRIIEWMVGRDVEREFPKAKHEIGDVRLRVSGVSGADVREVSLVVRRGEVLGITGLVGAGRTELARILAGAEPRAAGTIELDGCPVDTRDPRAAIRAGICLLTEDRARQGLVLSHGLVPNFGLPNLDRFAHGPVLRRSRERSAFAGFVDRLGMRITSPDQLAEELSGGNQQKLVLAKWLERDCDVVIIDEPTRGIDVGARYEFYVLIHELATAGKAVIMISSDLPEVLGMADRILVMRGGRVSGEIEDVAHATAEQIMELAIH